MPKIVGIKFKNTPKTYYFSAGNHNYELGAGVIVETAKGLEYGKVTILPKEVSEDDIVQPLKPIVRVANEHDEKKMADYEKRRPETMRIAGEKIEQSKLEMKLVDVEYAFDGSKLVIYFTSDGRVDFRELVKELASTFHIRIELRQIGERDECKMLGGIGPCGRACCCSDHMNDYAHVSIKMAKNQNLSLNPTKISGLCGRLMCCLAYENAHYAETNKRMPKVGSTVTTADNKKGVVTAINQLKETVRVKAEDGERIEIFDVALSDITSVRGKGVPEKEEKLPDDVKKLED